MALDAEWSSEVTARGYCQAHTLGDCWGGLEAHHVQGKGAHPSLRHDPSNGACLCRRHHRWAHDNPLRWREFLEEVMA